ncbi:MAG: insulinase family protein [Myxococcales bacterium]|nr:insulinase family protein [Myxococcales bacterium]
MRKISFALGAVAAVLMLSACNPETPRFAFKSAERRGVLTSNGLRFVIMPDSSTELVEVDVHYEVGSREDPAGKAGLAHLVEHLMFQTRPDGPNTPPIFQTLLDMATFVNAFTNWDMTHYWTTVREENLDSMLKIEAMRMFYAADVAGTPEVPAFGCSTVPVSEFEREREVVRNEIRAGSSAEDYIAQLVEQTMYPSGHAYARMIGGDDVQIASAQLKDACNFMKAYYAPERATLIIAGGVDVDKTVELVQKWFGKIPKRAAAPRVEVAPFVVNHQKVEIEADVERPSVWIGWALPAGNTPEGEAARFGIFSAFGRIAQKGQEYGFAYKVEPNILGGELAPLFLVRIELKSMGKLDEALEFAKKSAQQAYRGWDEGTYAELEESKNREKASFIASLEALPSRTLKIGQMVQHDREMDFNSTEMYMFHALNKIDKFDNSRIGSAVKKALDWDKAGIVVVKPNANALKGDTRSKVKFKANTDQAIVNAAVDPAEAKRPMKVTAELKGLNAASRFTLGNGMDVVLLPINAMPLVTAQIILKNTGDAATPDNPALASAAANFLQRVPDMDPNMASNTDVFSRTGIEINCGSSDDAMFCGTHGVNIYLDVMVKGIERMLVAGVYSQEGIERWQKRNKEDWKLHSTQEENEYVRQVMTAIYGPDHPYTKTAILTPEMANKIHKDSLDSYRNKHFRAGNATLILVGSFDPKKAESLVRSTFGGMGKGTVDKPVDPTPYKRSGPVYVGVKKSKEDQQVTVTIGYPAPAGVDGQEGARRVLSEMMNIRAENVRFKRGSTYGLYFARSAKVGPSAYMMRGGAVIGGTMDAERAGESIKAIRDGLDDMRKGDAEFDEDFVRARRKLIGNMLGESTVTQELAGRLGFIAQHKLPPNYYNTLLQQIAAVSPAQIRALIKTELDPANEVVVALGDKAHLDKAFAEAGIKDVKIVEPEYK